MNTVPMVVRRTPDGERAMDIASLLLQDRVVSFSTEVNDASAELVMKIGRASCRERVSF